LETYGLFIDGWLLFFNFSGCYLRWGKQCFFDRKFKNRTLRSYMDMPLFFSDERDKIQSLLTFPDLKKPDDILKIRQSNR